MESLFADIIVDISHENLDKTYQYAVPEALREDIEIGALVKIPFGKGNRLIQGYVLGLSTTPKIDPKLIKYVDSMVVDGIPIEGNLIKLAYWMKETFGATMNDALKTVIPVKKSVKQVSKRTLRLAVNEEVAKLQMGMFAKRSPARARLLELLIERKRLDFDEAVNQLKVGRPIIKALMQLNLIEIEEETKYRNPIVNQDQSTVAIQLTSAQQAIVDDFTKEYQEGIRRTYLLHGITGSGKTEVYMDMISEVISEGKQVIVLIPEIALTYQTVMRFYRRFGNRVTIMNSKMSQGERYDQSIRAKNGEIDICIGPRSALFMPFNHLGLIIIDEEHEGSYKSESVPKYHAREVAIHRSSLEGASVVLGSATPSIESYYKAVHGEYKLYTLSHRVGTRTLPQVWVVDLREELKKKNKSIFSIKLKELILDRLQKKQQIMLFLNRRGYAGFVSCRSCGHVMKCPHCDISLTWHNNGRLICHYCGFEQISPKKCPSCTSPYIAAFGTGTQKVEEMVKKEFPMARVLRMDADTTKNKGGHEKILAAFANHEADILVGTQMIVKGHDFPKVTLVGILAADLSLYTSDYLASERTFQLLTQAAGRAGRGNEAGEVVIQTYHPEHYSVQTAKTSDYQSFYRQEMAHRRLLGYPPVANFLVTLVTSRKEELCEMASKYLAEAMKQFIKKHEMEDPITLLGPTDANLKKANDIYRKVLYIKHTDYQVLVAVKNYLEGFVQFSEQFRGTSVQFDFNPMSTY